MKKRKVEEKDEKENKEKQIKTQPNDDEIFDLITKHFNKDSLMKFLVKFWPEKTLELGYDNPVPCKISFLRVCTSHELQRAAFLRARTDPVWFQHLRDDHPPETHIEQYVHRITEIMKQDIQLLDKCSHVLVHGKIVLELSTVVLDKYFKIPELTVEMLVKESTYKVDDEDVVVLKQYTIPARILSYTCSENKNVEDFLKWTSHGWHENLKKSQTPLNPSVMTMNIETNIQRMHFRLKEMTLWEKDQPLAWNTFEWSNNDKIDYEISLKAIEQAVETYDKVFDIMYNHLNMFEPLSRLIALYL